MFPVREYTAKGFSSKLSHRHRLEAKSPPRNTRRTFLDYSNHILHLTNYITDDVAWRVVIYIILREAVNTFANSLPLNHVLGVAAPPITDYESEMPCENRRILPSRLVLYIPNISNQTFLCMPTQINSSHTHSLSQTLWENFVSTISR